MKSLLIIQSLLSIRRDGKYENLRFIAANIDKQVLTF